MNGLRVGLIGANSEAGWAAGTHLPALAALDGVSLVAACTTREESARQTAERYGAAHALTDPAELVALPDVDLVVVSVHAYKHAALVELALEAGKPVFCEWPLGNGADVSERLAALAAAKGLPNFVCLQGFASPGALQMAQMLRDGAIGRLLSARALGRLQPWGATISQSTRYIATAANGATVASILGGHSLHMLARIAGDWDAFYGAAVNRRQSTRVIETDEVIPQTAQDQFVTCGILAGGAPASLQLAGGMSGREGFELELFGEEGSLRLTTPTIPEILPPLLEQVGADGAYAPVAPDPRFRLVPEALGQGPAVNVAQVYALILAELGGAAAPARAPGFAEAAALRRRIATTGG